MVVHTDPNSPPPPPKLMRSERHADIMNSIINSCNTKSSIVSGHHRLGTVWVAEYIKDNKVIYHTLEIPEFINDDGTLITKNVGEMLIFAAENGLIQASDVYHIGLKD